MEVMEVARQYPEVVPAGISMAALERDITPQVVLPLLVASRQLTRMLEDTLHDARSRPLQRDTRTVQGDADCR